MSARWVVLAVVGLVLVGGASVAYASSSPVEVQVDGEVVQARTFGDDVAAVLARLDVEVADGDRVEPSLDAPVERGMRVVVTRFKSVEIQLDDQPPRSVSAPMDTVADALDEAGVAELLDSEARIDPAPDTRVADGDRIEVARWKTVTLVADGDERELTTYAATVAEVLEEAEVVLGEDDLVEPALHDGLEPAAVVVVRRVEIVEEVVEASFAPDEQRSTTEDLRTGETEVEAEGEDGLREETWEVTLVDGEEADRELVAEEVLRESVDRIVVEGTGPTLVEEAQALLTDLGYPVGSVDGVDGPQTRRALCAWRRLEGREASRAPFHEDELEALQATSGLPAADRSGRGVLVDRTCQALYYHQDGDWQDVHAASTGADGLPNTGSYRIQRVRPGWHTSTLYPAPEPNMYNTMYIRGAIAIHGSNSVPPHPASAGCVRVTPEVADRLFADLGVGDPVEVIGTY